RLHVVCDPHVVGLTTETTQMLPPLVHGDAVYLDGRTVLQSQQEVCRVPSSHESGEQLVHHQLTAAPVLGETEVCDGDDAHLHHLRPLDHAVPEDADLNRLFGHRRPTSSWPPACGGERGSG